MGPINHLRVRNGPGLNRQESGRPVFNRGMKVPVAALRTFSKCRAVNGTPRQEPYPSSALGLRKTFIPLLRAPNKTRWQILGRSPDSHDQMPSSLVRQLLTMLTPVVLSSELNLNNSN